MGLRVAKIDQNPIAHVLGDEPINAADGRGDRTVIVADHLTQILGVKPGREHRRADQIAEHHRQLPAFGLGGRRCVWGRHRRGGWNRSADRGNGVEQPSAIADQRDAEVL